MRCCTFVRLGMERFMRRTILIPLSFVLALGACGDEPAETSGETAQGSGGTSSTGAAATTSSSGAGGSTSTPGLPDLGALVVLGDSISDGGGEGPFYYDLLLADLEAHYDK